MKEIEDLIEDEEEDVVCAMLESGVQIIAYLQSNMAAESSHIEKCIAPIIGKILTLAQNKKVGPQGNS